MKKIYHLLVITIVSIIAVSCTHNNGDIGEYFGTWKLESININGEIEADYMGNIFWKFQASVFCLQKVDPYYTADARYGTWEQIGDNILRLNFTHHDDSGLLTVYTPFPESHLSRGVIDLTIVSISSSAMELNYTDNNGDLIKYKLKKW